MRVNDALMAFPAILLAIGITAVLGPSRRRRHPGACRSSTSRAPRASCAPPCIVLREMEYVQAAVAAGAGHWRILRRHILPNAMAPLIVQLSFLFAYAVLTEATLSFLGLGAVPPTPTWGNIMAEGRQYMTDAPWIITIPGAALMITVLGLNLLGDGLRDVLDPRLQDPAMSLLEVATSPPRSATERGEITAIEDVSFDPRARARSSASSARSGSGKSVTALTIMGLLPQPAGARRRRAASRFEGQELTAAVRTRACSASAAPASRWCSRSR